MSTEKRLIRVDEVARLTGLTQSTIYRMERQGIFPKKRQISSNTVGWLLSEIEEFIDSRETVS